ncbi:PE-PPE domain-containing protein [Mycobacterium sp. C3-094]
MKRATKAVMTAAALPIAATLPLTFGGAAMPAAAAAAAAATSSASSVIPPGPATVLHHGPTPWDMADNLGGALCEAPKVCKEVRYDWIQPYGPIEFGVTENVNRLDWAIHHVGTDPKIVYAFSGGARIASVWLQDHAEDKDAPAPEDLSFVLLGNGGRKYGGVNGWFWGDLLRTPTDTQYDVVDVAGEYDPIADFPTNPFNLLAVANGVAAFVYVHLRYDEVDLDDPDNIVWKEGKTTYVYVPTEHLPLLQGFYDLGLGSLVADIEPKLREIVDKAYDRTWLEGKPTLGDIAAGAETTASTSVTTPQARPLVRAADTKTADTETADSEKNATEATGTGGEHASARPDTTPSPESPDTGSDSESEQPTDPDVVPADEPGDIVTPDDRPADDATAPDGEQPSDTPTEASDGDGDTGTASAPRAKHRMPLRGVLKAIAAEKATKTAETAKSDTSRTSSAKTASSSAGGGTDSQN